MKEDGSWFVLSLLWHTLLSLYTIIIQPPYKRESGRLPIFNFQPFRYDIFLRSML